MEVLVCRFWAEYDCGKRANPWGNHGPSHQDATRSSTATRTSTIPSASGTTCPSRRRSSSATPTGAVTAKRWLNGDHAGHGRRQRPLPGLQPDLHRGPADEQEDHAEAQLDAAHRRPEGLPPPRRRHRPRGAPPRDGPHGHRPGARDPDDGDHARAVRDERRGRRRVLPRPTTTSSSTGAARRAAASSPPPSSRARRRVHGQGDRARRRPRVAGRSHPPDRRRRPSTPTRRRRR